jgi:L-lactate dehydrogenase complex protein LldG
MDWWGVDARTCAACGVVSARETILGAVRAARPARAPLPDVRSVAEQSERTRAIVVERFRAAAGAAGARVLMVDSRECVRSAILEVYPGAARVLSWVPDVRGSVVVPGRPRELDGTDLFVCEAVFGVAETGAVWVPDHNVPYMAALFLATHVAIVLKRAAVVSDVHQAYARQGVRLVRYGVFVAGPSKTADIAQALVVGAHGPLSLTIVLVG